MSKVKSLLNQKYIREYVVYIIFGCGSTVLNFLNNIFLTSLSSEVEFGLYRFYIDYIAIIPIIFGFGISYSIAKLVATDDDTEKRKIIGSSIITFGILSIISIIGSLILSMIMGDYSYLFVSIFSFIPLYNALLNMIFQGEGRIISLSMFGFFPKLGYLVCLMVLTIFHFKMDGKSLFYIYLIFSLIANLIYLCKIKFNFISLKENIRLIMKENKKNGIKIYYGSLFNTLIGQLLPILAIETIGISYYGYYSSALTLIMPITMLCSTYGIISFKDNTKRDSMDLKKIILFLLVVVVLTFIFAVICNIILMRFNVTIKNSIYYFNFLIPYGILLGVGDLFNKFLMAKSHGKGVMISDILNGLVCLSIILLFLKPLGIFGLILAKTVGVATYFASMLYQYRKLIRNIN